MLQRKFTTIGWISGKLRYVNLTLKFKLTKHNCQNPSTQRKTPKLKRLIVMNTKLCIVYQCLKINHDMTMANSEMEKQ